MIYLLDASTLITANALYYPVERVPEFWDWLGHHAMQGTVKLPIEIYEEVTDGPDDEERDQLYAWLQSIERDRIVLPGESDPELITKVLATYAPDLLDTEVEQIGRDPFLIAAALADPAERVVVTAEVSAPKKIRHNRRIPDVCRDLGIRCIDVFALNREMNFSTSWRS